MTGYEVTTQISLCCDTPTIGAMIYTKLKELDTGGYVEWKLAVVKGKMWNNYSLLVPSAIELRLWHGRAY